MHVRDRGGVSEALYRLKAYAALGADNHEDFVFWEPSFVKHDANDLLAQLATWEYGDISDNSLYKKDLVAALSAIQARTIVLPVDMDRFFPPVDSLAEAEHTHCKPRQRPIVLAA
jgi:homoserine O-acetyltransferase